MEMDVQIKGSQTYLISLCRIFAGILEDDLGPTWMLWHELRYIVRLAVHNDPAVLVIVVLLDFLATETHDCYSVL